MKKLLKLKNLVVALVLVAGLTGIASFVSASQIATIQYAGKDPIKISKETNDIPNTSIWYQDFENQSVEIDIFDYPTKQIKLSILKPDGNLVENPDTYYEVISDIDSGKEKVHLDITNLLNGDGVYKIQAKQIGSDNIDFEIHIIVDNTPPVVEVYLGKGEDKELISNKDDLKSKYNTNELTIKVKDENFDPKENKGNYTVPKNSEQKEDWELKDGYWVATFILAQGENTLDVTVTDEAGNQFVLPGNLDKIFTVDTEGPNIDINITNEVKMITSTLEINIFDKHSDIDYDKTIVTVNGDKEFHLDKEKNSNTLSLEDFEGKTISIDVQAYDEIGNYSYLNIDSLTLDATAPIIDKITFNQDSLGERYTYLNPIEVSITFSEENFEENGLNIDLIKRAIQKSVTQVEWSHDEQNKVHTATFNVEKDGEYTLDFIIKDLAGNETQSDTLSFMIDTKAPEIIIEDKKGNTLEDGDVYHTLELVSKINDENPNSDTETYTLFKVDKEGSIESGKFENHQLSLIFDDSYEDGEYTLKIHAEDKAGRISTKEITFSIDRTAPSLQDYKYSDFIVEKIETETQLKKLYFNTSTVIELPIIDEHLDLENSILLINNNEYSFVDNEEYSFGSLSFENNLLKIEFNKDGEYIIDLDKVLDSAGNETEKEKFPKALKIVVDTKNPIINIQVDEENLEDIEKNYGFINHDLTIDISIDDLTPTEFTCVYTAESESSKEKQCLLTQEDDKFKLELAVADNEVDTFNIKLTAKDIVEYETTKEFSITIDKVKPVVDYAVNEEDKISENDSVYYFDKGIAVDVFIKEHHFDETSPIVTYKYGKTKDSSLQEFVKDKDDLVWESVTDKENTYKATIELENDGYYYFDNVYVVDKASNKVDTTQPSLNLAIDTKEPEFVYEDVVKLSNKDQKLTIEVKDITYKELTYTVTKTNYITKETEILVDNVTTSASKLVLDEHFKTDGTYNVNVTAVDWAGNSSEISREEITFTIDKVAPVVSKYELNAEIRKDQGVKYYSSGQEIKIYIDEFYFDEFDKHPTEVKEVIVDLIYKSSINGEEKDRKYNLSWEKAQNRNDQYIATIKVEEDGYYELKDVKVTDQVGNEATSKPEAEKMVIDTVKPIIHVSDVKNEFYYKKGDKVTINVSIDETNFNPNLSTYTIYRKESLNSEEKVYLSGNITSQTDFKLPTLTENGEYRVVLTAKDMSDNQVEKETELHFYIDHNDPKVSIKPVTANTANGSQQNVSEVVIGLSATDDWKLANTKYTVKRNNEVINVPKQGEWEDFKLSFKDEGYYQVEIETDDQAGTKTVKETLEFTIDRTSPSQLSIIGNANHHNSTTSVKDGESYSTPRINLQFNAQDMYSFDKISVDVTKNGKVYASQTFDVKDSRDDFTNTFNKNANYSLSEEGEYEVTFTVYDQAGNQSNEKLSFEIDRTNPIITSNIEDGKYYNEDFLPEFTLDQPERDEFTFINIDEKNYKNNIPFLINDKVYTISALATDKAQNTTDYNATITVDKTTPTIGISNLITGFFKDTLSPSIFYNDTNLDTSKVSIKLNNVELGAGVGDENGYTKEIDINKDGTYTLEVSIEDLATNVSKQTIDFVLDNEKPVIKIKNVISLHNQPWIPELEVLEEYGYDIIMATLNGEEYDITQPITTEGKNVLFIQVADKAGNTESITIEFILDLTPPKVIIENAETNQLVEDGDHYLTSLDLKIYLDYLEGESQDYEEIINSILLNDEPQNLNVTMENGRKVYHLSLNEFKDYTLKVKATDSAGNEITEIITFTLGDKDIFTKIYENKTVFYSIITIAGLSIVGAGIYSAFVLRNKSIKKQESSEE